jgi:hypothetical protein
MLRKDSELASAADMEIPLCVGTLDEVVGLVRPLYDEWKKSAKVPS